MLLAVSSVWLADVPNACNPKWTFPQMMALRDFDDLTDKAFAYLQENCGYRAEPTQVGGRFGTACVRYFIRDELGIVLVVGDADSSHFCSILFVEGIGSQIENARCIQHDLMTLLEQRYPEFQPPALRDLPTRSSQIETIRKYALLLRDFARDAIDGDYSVFAA